MKADAPVLRGRACRMAVMPFRADSPARYGLSGLKAARISEQTAPARAHQARCAAAAPVRSASTICGSGLVSIATPFWRDTYASIADTVIHRYGIDGA